MFQSLEARDRKRGKTRGVIAGLVPAISIGTAQCSIIGMAGTSPAMTKRELPRLLPLLRETELHPKARLGLKFAPAANLGNDIASLLDAQPSLWRKPFLR